MVRAGGRRPVARPEAESRGEVTARVCGLRPVAMPEPASRAEVVLRPGAGVAPARALSEHCAAPEGARRAIAGPLTSEASTAASSIAIFMVHHLPGWLKASMRHPATPFNPEQHR